MTQLGEQTWPRAWTVLLMAALMTTVEGRRSHPTRVPGSDHLVMHTEFPYAFWRASSRPYTPGITSPHYIEAPSYPYFYGEAKDDPSNDSTTWQIMPIQIPNDLVSDSNQRTQQTTNQVPRYPTSPTPQYGRHPGVTEPPPLFHPERLYSHARNDSHNKIQPAGGSSASRHQVQRYSNEEGTMLEDSFTSYQSKYSKPPQQLNQTEKLEVSLPWHQSLIEQLEPLIDSHLPKLTSLPKLPEWPLRVKQDTRRIQTDTQAEKSATTINGEHVVHKFYHIIPDTNMAYQETMTQRQNNRPSKFYEPHNEQNYSSNQFPSVQNNPNYPNDHVIFTVDSKNYASNQYSQSGNHNYPNVNFPPTEQIPINNQHFSANRAGYEPHKHDIYAQDDNVETDHKDLTHSGPEGTEWYATDNQSVETWERRRPDQYRPSKRHRRPGYQSHSAPGQYYKNNIKERPYTDQRWPSNDSNHPLHHMNGSIKTHLNPYRNRTQKPIRQSTHQVNRPESQQGFSSYAYLEPQDYRYPTDDLEDQYPTSLELYPDSSIIDRLANLDPLSPSVVLPGGLMVIALALAVFYFNYVWYPTPVVTAKMVKVLLDAAPADIIIADQEKAIGKVYEVFRSLEATYTQDQDLWSPACKSRLVCQVHQEFPGLWQVTQAYAALVRSNLTSSPEGDGDFNVYLQAAQQGTGDATCSDQYPACTMTPVPVRASLQRLVGIVQDDYPEVIYS